MMRPPGRRRQKSNGGPGGGFVPRPEWSIFCFPDQPTTAAELLEQPPEAHGSRLRHTVDCSAGAGVARCPPRHQQGAAAAGIAASATPSLPQQVPRLAGNRQLPLGHALDRRPSDDRGQTPQARTRAEGRQRFRQAAWAPRLASDAGRPSLPVAVTRSAVGGVPLLRDDPAALGRRAEAARENPMNLQADSGGSTAKKGARTGRRRRGGVVTENAAPSG